MDKTYTSTEVAQIILDIKNELIQGSLNTKKQIDEIYNYLFSSKVLQETSVKKSSAKQKKEKEIGDALAKIQKNQLKKKGK